VARGCLCHKYCKKIVIFLKNFYIFLTTREILDKLQWTKVCGFGHSKYERTLVGRNIEREVGDE
jgi:hypothetical protein